MLWVALTCALIAIDGDTVRCGQERIRLLAIDAPELPGHCRRYRRCVSGDPFAAKRSLQSRLHGPALIHRTGRDRYGRTLAWIKVAGIDLSCHQLRTGYARYRSDWDVGRQAAKCA